MTIQLRPVDYTDGDLPLHGYLAWDDTAGGPRPGVLLVHGGAGLDDHSRGQAKRYAGLGYTVLACDMYGEQVSGDRERFMALLTRLRDDRDLLVRRAQAGMDALAAQPEAAGVRAAVGFCFGGMTVITLARAGLPLDAVVSMHGSLATSQPARPGQVRARILACHGALDPHVPMTDVAAFAEEMDAAGADWQLIAYGGAVHGFTHAEATGSMPGVAYHAPTDARSFAAAQAFLADAVG